MSGRRRLLSAAFSLWSNLCGLLGGLLLWAILWFLLLEAWPALREEGLLQLLSWVWEPQTGQFGVLSMLCCTLAVGLGAVALALPVAVLGAACIQTLLPRTMARWLQSMLSLLAGMPSVLIGLVGLLLLLPLLSALFPQRMAGSGGATLLAAILVLASSLLPELLLTLLEELSAVGAQVDQSSLSLGATPVQTVFFAQLPALTQGICAAGLAGFRRACAEGVAVLLVSGNVVGFPSLFQGARTLASGLLLEMGYATGLHRSALFAMALLLLVLTLLFGGFGRGRN